MTITPTALLSLPIITTGTESGTWGDVVDNGLTYYLDIAIAGGLAITITTADVTLANTAGTSAATNIGSTTAQYAILNVSGAMTAARNLILPSSSRAYTINNSCTGGFLLTVKGAATTGVTVQNGERVRVAWNGSDYVKVGPGITSAGDTNDLLSVQGVTLGKGNNANTSNTAYGVNALKVVNAPSTGDLSTLNTAIGYLSLQTNNVGYSNVGVGSSALKVNTSGYDNVAVGDRAMFKSIDGWDNVAIGKDSLLNSLSGLYNVSVGAFALRDSSTGNGNTAVGQQALFSTTTSYNTAVGFTALLQNITGTANTAVGSSALLNPTTSSYNTGIGSRSLGGASGSGQYNTAIGADSGFAVTSGSGNVIVGGYTAAGASAPAFSITTQNNYISMGSTSVTNAYIQVAWTVVSDARDKTDFADVPHGLDFVSKLQPTAYRFKENRDTTEGHGPVRYGFKAQDVLALEGDTPVIIDAANPDKLYFNDQSMIAVLVNAIKELKADFDAYKAAHA